MLLLALQTCPTDIQAALELCKLIADNEEAPRNEEFWIVARKDTPLNLIQGCVQILQQKFINAKSVKPKNHGTGYPHGANMLWNSAMTEAEVFGKTKAAKKAGYDGVFTFEADCVPMVHDWIDQLTLAWKAALANGFQVLGHWHQKGMLDEHINGNAVFALDLFTKNTALRGAPTNVGWDIWHRRLLTKIGTDTDLIFQHYQRPTISKIELESIHKNGNKPAIFHGVKDATARRLIREAWFGGKHMSMV